MANIHSQKKRILRAERERLENRRYTSSIKTYFHRLEQAVAAGEDETADTEHRCSCGRSTRPSSAARCIATTARVRSPAPLACAAAPEPRRAPARPQGGFRQISVPPTSDRIAFELERLGAAAPGRLEVHGRWYGVRGRRFVRPALILAAENGRSRRILAELDDKPWAAEDGEPWRAAFRIEAEPPAGSLELSVAPDITVSLRPDGAGSGDGPNGGSPTRTFAAAAAAPRAKDTPNAKDTASAKDTPSAKEASSRATDRPAAAPAARRTARPPQARAPDSERLTSRLAAAETALAQERERRVEAEAALEEQRSQARGTTAELGRLRAELELAHAAELQARDTAAQLDAARRDHHTTQERYQALATEHQTVLRDHAAIRTELEARTGDLRSARDTLTSERTQRSELEARAARTVPEAAESPTRSSGATTAHGGQGHPAAAPHLPPPPRSHRPLNPSLQSNSWLLRAVAVLVIAAALLAIYIVLHSTVLS